MFRRWLYRLEKGRPHLIMLTALLLGIFAMSVLGGLAVYLLEDDQSLGGAMWWTFLHFSDPGYLGDDATPTSAVLGTLFTVIGMIAFMAGLVGILTSMITSALSRLREGGGPVAFVGHTVLVGWNSRIYNVLIELLDASQEEEFVILADRSKDMAEIDLDRRLFAVIKQNHGAKAMRRARSQVVYRQGNPLIEQDLMRANATQADRFVLLSPGEFDSDEAHDVAQIRTLYAIDNVRAELGPYNTVVELVTDTLRAHAFYSLKMEPRQDAFVDYREKQLLKKNQVSYFPEVKGERSENNMTVVDASQLVGRIIAQCALQPFLSLVYNELLSFEGKEVFLWEPDAVTWSLRFEQLSWLPENERMVQLASQLYNAIPIGAYEDGKILFDIESITTLSAGRALVLVGDKQTWEANPDEEHDKTFAPPRPERAKIGKPPLPPDFHILLLGYNDGCELIAEQLSEYVDQYEHVTLNVTLVIRSKLVAESDVQSKLGAGVKLNMVTGDYTEWSVMGPLLETGTFNTVVVLGEDEDVDESGIDARVTLGLVMLRAFRDDPKWSGRLANAHIVAEIRDTQNLSILDHEQLTGDVIVGDKYVSGFMAQVCTDYRLEEVFRELMDYGDYDLYTRPLNSGASNLRFVDVVQSAADRGEVAVACLVEREGGVEVVLAPPLYETLEGAIQAIVIAEN